MKIIKKAVLILFVAMICTIIYTNTSKATTLKTTADTLNLREKASTDSSILTLISKGEECELIEEDGDWYKVKYESYTGYVSKEYAEKVEDSSNENTISDETDNDVDDQDAVSDNKTNDNTTETDKSESNDSKVTTGKITKDSKARILPLINSSALETLKKDTNVTVVTELSGWSYIETDSISAWVRSDSIKIDNSNKTTTGDTSEPKENDNNTNKDDESDENTNTSTQEKVMYVNDSYVNLRKEPSTSSEVLMVVALNTKLTVIGEEGSWYKVKTSAGNAYVSKELLSDKQTSTSRGSTTVRGATENIEAEDLENPEKVTTTTTGQSTTKSTNSSTSTTTNSSTKGSEIVAYAKKFLGVPYVYGGASTSGFDCSGFTMYVYQHFGISMRHGAQAQAKLGTAVNADKTSASSLKQKLQPGDLVFFLDYETMDEIGHCGIYVGDGNFIHASSGTGYCVKIDSLLPGEYYNTRYCAARRLI